MSDAAHCPECSWTREADTRTPDQLVTLVTELESHLASTHDWTWQRAHEHARAWSRQVLSLPPNDPVPSLKGSRTVHCPTCNWTERAVSEELFEISRCSSALEEHLRTDHGASPEDASRAAESWALALLHGRIK